MSLRRVSVLCSLVGALGLLAAPGASDEGAEAGGPSPASEERPIEPVAPLTARSERALRINVERESARVAVQSEYRELLGDYRAARERVAAAQKDWGRKRRRQRLRGEPREEARAEIDASQQALADAMTAIRDFHERARREGAEPGWLYQVEDEFPDIASAVASP